MDLRDAFTWVSREQAQIRQQVFVLGEESNVCFVVKWKTGGSITT